MRGGRLHEVERVWLTASGGPFLHTPAPRFAAITVEQALNHPTWKMGRRITIDSATLMNKGFEVIEACRLFDLPPEQVQVMVHPQSTVHSMVEFVDGSLLAQVSVTDMRLPILYALTYPERIAVGSALSRARSCAIWTFSRRTWTSSLACGWPTRRSRRAGRRTIALNAADEVAVAAFLEGKFPFRAFRLRFRQFWKKRQRPDLNL